MAKRSSKAWKQADGSNGGVQNPNKRHKPFYEELDATDAIDIRTANLDTVLNAFPKEWTKFQQIQLRLTIFNMPVTDVTMHLRDFYLLVCPIDAAEVWRIINSRDVRWAIDHNRSDNINGLRCSRIICTLVGLQNRIHRQHSQQQCHPELHKQLETLELDYRMLYLLQLNPPPRGNRHAFQELPGGDNQARIRSLLEKSQQDPNPASVGGHSALANSSQLHQPTLGAPAPSAPTNQSIQLSEKSQQADNFARLCLQPRPNTLELHDILGHDDAKKAIVRALRAGSSSEQQNIQRMKEDELNPPNNKIMLFGSSGIGKSALVQAIAAAHDRRLLFVSMNALSRYVGDAEANLTAGFELAQKEKPVVIFVDEYDELCGTHMMDMLLNHMDKAVTFVAAVNNFESLGVRARSRFVSVDMHAQQGNDMLVCTWFD